MVFPKDAITFNAEIDGADDLIITTKTPTTILGIRMQQSGTQSETDILCGNVLIAKNYGTRDYPLDLIQFACNDILKVEKTGQGDKAFVSVTYVEREITMPQFTSPLEVLVFDIGLLLIFAITFWAIYRLIR